MAAASKVVDPSDKPSAEVLVPNCQAPIVELMCRYCRKLCFSEDELSTHEKTHLDNKKLMCRLCGKGFARRSYLSEHMLIHSGVCPWKCDQCSKTFALRCNLVRHMRVHSGEKPFNCELCSKSFTLKKNMQEHRLTHTKEKPFGCPQCGRKFARRSSLVRHARTHTDSRHFECAHCTKRFPWKYYLQRHLSNKHNDPPKITVPKKRNRRTKAEIARDKAAKEAAKNGVKEVPIVNGHQIKIEEGEGTTRVFLSTPACGDHYEFEGTDSIKEETLPAPVEESGKKLTDDVPAPANDAHEYGKATANEKDSESAFESIEIKEEVIDVEEETDIIENKEVDRIPFTNPPPIVLPFRSIREILMADQRLVNVPRM